ncbi:OsmC family protein [Sedimentibacter sp. MB31-C6]|uniref:OsmC family protein n=1 Tax=Sedimentibacter sp. MB31-C6 TaxID=3109366 RepID=UPI002DDD9036|nr:OsmC family protein [Sedimentibacter sp. MB36-C1]WSI02943.1 OsmC family protein [Sedimentibacter sp. MB36-C1]
MLKTQINAKLIGNMAFEMDINGHKVTTDTTVENGGNNLGPSPKALLLAGLVGCSGIDIMSMIEENKINVDDLNVYIESETRDEDPKIYNYIKILYKFKGKNLSFNELEKIVKLSMEKYCGVAAMLEKVVPITYEVKIEE